MHVLCLCHPSIPPSLTFILPSPWHCYIFHCPFIWHCYHFIVVTPLPFHCSHYWFLYHCLVNSPKLTAIMISCFLCHCHFLLSHLSIYTKPIRQHTMMLQKMHPLHPSICEYCIIHNKEYISHQLQQGKRNDLNPRFSRSPYLENLLEGMIPQSY